MGFVCLGHYDVGTISQLHSGGGKYCNNAIALQLNSFVTEGEREPSKWN